MRIQNENCNATERPIVHRRMLFFFEEKHTRTQNKYYSKKERENQWNCIVYRYMGVLRTKRYAMH